MKTYYDPWETWRAAWDIRTRRERRKWQHKKNRTDIQRSKRTKAREQRAKMKRHQRRMRG